MEKKKILIADDDIGVHTLLRKIISSNGFDVIHAYDGQETVERINNEQPDLVVLDILMPFKDGRDICRDLKKNPKTQKIKILMLSGKSEQFDRIAGLEMGADDYITKPFSPDHLVNKIKKILKKAEQTHQHQ